MPATVESSGPAPDAGTGDGTSASSPLILLVFGLVLVILLQAWFVRRISQLTARHKERKGTYGRLRVEAAELAEEVSGLDRARESSVASVAGLERETQELQGRIDAFVAEHEGVTEAAATSVSTAAESVAEPGETTDASPASGDS